MLRALSKSILVLIVFFTPLALGTVHAWSIGFLEIAISFIFLFYLLRSIKKGRIEYVRNPFNAFLLLLILYALFQILTGITKSPYESWVSLKGSIFYLLFFLALSDFLADRKEIDDLLFTVMLAGLSVSILGMLQLVTGTRDIYWIKPPFQRYSFFGSFANANHFACYASMIAIVLTGRFLYAFSKRDYITPAKNLLQQALSVISKKLMQPGVLFTLFSIFIIICAIFLSSSRAGISCFIAVYIILIGSFLLRKRPGALFSFVLILLVVVGGILFFIGPEKTISEIRTIFELHKSYVEKTAANLDALMILESHPFFGIGAGSFSSVSPLYKTGLGIRRNKLLYNDILQSVIELGVFGFILILVPLLLFIGVLISKYYKTKSHYKHYVLLGIMCSFLYLFLHSLIEVDLKVNAIVVLFIIFAAIGFSVAGMDKYRKAVYELQTIISIKKKSAKYAAYCLSFVLFLVLGFFALGPFAAARLINNDPSFRSFSQAFRLDPGNPGIYYEYYRFIMKTYNAKGLTADLAYRKASKAIDTAIRLEPCNTFYIIAKAELESWRGDNDTALFYYKKAALREPNDPRIQMTYAYAIFRIAREEKDPEKRKSLIEKGRVYHERAQYLTKGKMGLYYILRDKAIRKKFKKDLGLI